MEPHLDLVDRIRDYLDPLTPEERAGVKPSQLARQFPEIAGLNDEDIHLIAEGYVSWVDYEETEIESVHELIIKAREIARAAR